MSSSYNIVHKIVCTKTSNLIRRLWLMVNALLEIADIISKRNRYSNLEISGKLFSTQLNPSEILRRTHQALIKSDISSDAGRKAA